jgi:hypothetical protein
VKRKVFRLLGYLFSVFPPLGATLYCFPELYVRERGPEAVSLGVLLLIGLSVLPLWRRLYAALKTPSAPLLWAILLFVFYLARLVADEIVFISGFGLVGALLGAVCFRLGGLGRGGDGA